MTYARIPDFGHTAPVRFETVVLVPSDPVLAAIETHAEAWASFQVAPTGRLTEEAETALGQALEDLLCTPCGSRFGALALVRHLRWLIREEAIPADTDDILGRLVLTREADLCRFAGSDLPPEYLPLAAPLGRLSAGEVRRLSPAPAKASFGSMTRLHRAAGLAGEALVAVAIIGGGAVLTGLATLL